MHITEKTKSYMGSKSGRPEGEEELKESFSEISEQTRELLDKVVALVAKAETIQVEHDVDYALPIGLAESVIENFEDALNLLGSLD